MIAMLESVASYEGNLLTVALGAVAVFLVVYLVVGLWDGDCRLIRRPMKGYKGFRTEDGNLRCINMHYMVGRRYTLSERPRMCGCGYHFCRKLNHTFAFYDPSGSVAYCEVVADGRIVRKGRKYCTNDLTVVRRLSDREIVEILKREGADTNWFRYFFPEPEPLPKSEWPEATATARKPRIKRKSYRRYSRKALARLAQA